VALQPQFLSALQHGPEGAHFGTREQADNLRKPGKKAAKPYVVDIKNPLRVRDMGTWTLDGIATELLMQDVITQADYDAIRAEFLWTDERGFAKLKAVLAALGYDGFVYDNEQEGQGDSYVAFYSKQIKPYRMAESLDDFDPKEFAMQPSVIYRHPVWDVTTKELRQWLASPRLAGASHIHRRKRGRARRAALQQESCGTEIADYIQADDLKQAVEELSRHQVQVWAAKVRRLR
jgi:hypothetical protein